MIIFHEKPNHTVESIEERLNEINMERIQDKEEKSLPKKKTDKNVTIDEE